MVANDTDKRLLLTRECTEAETIWRSILRQEEASGEEVAMTESPLKPWIVDQAQIILLYRIHKTSCLLGSTSGSGIAIARLPSPHRTLVRWSAPLFLTISAKSFGISFGSESKDTFAVATAPGANLAFSGPEGHPLRGFDFNFACGAGLQERSEVISTNFAPDIGLVGVSKVSGAAFDLSFFVSGAMAVDTEKCRAVYGTDPFPAAILASPGPEEFQPLYGELSRVVSTVEHPQYGPARISASLERFSTGSDPDRVMVLPDGVIIREDLKEPPK